ncbi:MAG: phosphotransferase [Phycisphaerae bacterium]|nr:phosphotransferase [Saprospiraceae bacterium]
MLLSYENIAHYLLEKGLIDLDSIMRGEFSVRDQSSRNANFAINREYKPAYLVKQVRAQDQEKRETLRIEATCYWLANNDEAYRTLQGFLPRYHEYDYLHHILVLELLPDVQNLHEYYRGAALFPISVAEKLADLLACYHTHVSGVVENQKSFSLFKKRKPWVFTLSENNLSDWLNNPTLGNAEKQSVKLILENKEFMEHLRLISEDWETKSLVHGDVKFPNFLINTDFTLEHEPDIRLIDWELADIGDPLWDVAAVFQNYLTLWVSSEIEQQYRPGQSAIVSLEQVQPSIAAFWQRYAEKTRWDDAAAKQHLEKTLRYTALKLVHTCFESVQAVKDMSLYSAKILQLSLNLLRRPDVAIGELLGIQTNAHTHATTVLS